jgi:hypothetical protein
VLRTIGFEGTSDDESSDEGYEDSKDVKYIIKTLKWRGSELNSVLRSLDAVAYSLDRFNTDNAEGFRFRSSAPYPPVEIREPPHHLPVNFYDYEYLKTLSGEEIAILDPRLPFDCDFIHNAFRCVDTLNF